MLLYYHKSNVLSSKSKIKLYLGGKNYGRRNDSGRNSPCLSKRMASKEQRQGKGV